MSGLMEEYIMVNGLITKWKVKELLLGAMGENMLGNIKMIKNMELEHLNGLMVVNMRVSTLTTKRKVKVFSTGPMDVNTKGNG
jgi:hypothetical protein